MLTLECSHVAVGGISASQPESVRSNTPPGEGMSRPHDGRNHPQPSKHTTTPGTRSAEHVPVVHVQCNVNTLAVALLKEARVQRVPNWEPECYSFFRHSSAKCQTTVRHSVPSANKCHAMAWHSVHSAAQCQPSGWHSSATVLQCLTTTAITQSKIKENRVI